VLQAIRNLKCSKEFTALNFQGSEYVDSTGRKLPMYNMTKNGFVMLTMGFTSEKAFKFKEAYIAAFDKMEQALIDQHITWAVVRRDTKDDFKLVNYVLTNIRKNLGKETKAFHYSNEALMMNKVLTGKREKIDRNKLSSEELDLLVKIQKANADLIFAIPECKVRGDMLIKMFTKQIEEK